VDVLENLLELMGVCGGVLGLRGGEGRHTAEQDQSEAKNGRHAPLARCDGMMVSTVVNCSWHDGFRHFIGNEFEGSNT
jgi:hypothetical protein